MNDASRHTTTPGGFPYVKSLDGVRAASILLVLAGHTLPLGPNDWGLNSVAARSGMALFFCLSGYLIVTILHRNTDIIEFFVKRLCRIVPSVALYLTILVVFFGLPLTTMLLNLTFLSNYFTQGIEGGPLSHLWSLCVEVQFYVAIALVVLLLGRRGLWLVPVAAIFFTGLRIDDQIIVNINTHWRVDEILAGGCLALVHIHAGEAMRRWLANPVMAGTLIAILTALFLLSGHNDGYPFYYFRPYFSAILVGVILFSNVKPLMRVLESRVAGYIARISYALYIYHPLMVSGFMNTGSDIERYLLKRPVSYALTWAAAHVSTFYWEAWWQKAARSYLARRDAGRAEKAPVGT
ncbi:acyltransferase [Palleronia sp. LCG004]|uniref:acyltransferase family protein n=1 Tax=Palleronia sp. LCG004 TaxID=3079304 RepID=UPI0029421BF5|nr:acyltransferase [Palleronia sp. LCG004]WOI58396.1 acyltransferase [Palleronia sp. LCG004]